MTVTFADIDEARRRIAGAVAVRPASPRRPCRRLAGAEIRLKFENLQYTGSFKERGALNKLLSLTPEQRARGVIAMSAGNHAQGVAYHASGSASPPPSSCRATRRSPRSRTPGSYGARVVLHGEGVRGGRRRTPASSPSATGSPSSIPTTIRSSSPARARSALEMLEAAPDLDMLVVPIGGGGLIAGIATAAKALKPGDRDHRRRGRASTPRCSSMLRGPAGDHARRPDHRRGHRGQGAGRADARRSSATWSTTSCWSPRTSSSARSTLCSRSRRPWPRAPARRVWRRCWPTPSGFAGRQVGLVVCGGNIDTRLLASMLMRGLVRDGRLVRLRIAITDAPGALARVTRLIGEAGGDIVEVFHHRLFHDLPVKMADIDVILETRNPAHVDQIIASLGEGGFPAELMEDVD